MKTLARGLLVLGVYVVAIGPVFLAPLVACRLDRAGAADPRDLLPPCRACAGKEGPCGQCREGDDRCCCLHPSHVCGCPTVTGQVLR